MKKFYIALVAVTVIINVYGQQKPQIISSGDTIMKGVGLFDNGNYQEALDLYQKVPENDTNYYIDLTEQVLTYYKLEKYQEGIDLGMKGLKMNLYLSPILYLNVGDCYDMLKQYDDAVKIYDQGLKEFPKSYLIWYNKAFSLKMAGKVKEAFACLQQSINLNPFHPKSHYLLGVIAMNEGKSSLAMLAFSMYLILNPNSDFSNSGLVALNDIASSKYQEKTTPTGSDITDGDDYSDIDMLISNYAAMNKKYKVPSKLTMSFVKQTYMLFDKLPVNPENKGFWYRTYIPFYKQMLKEKYFEAFSYNLLQASGNEQHKKMAQKNKAKINSFIEWFKPTWNSLHRKATLDFNGKLQRVDVMRTYNSFAIGIAGTYDSIKQKFNGYAEAYYENGRLKAKGFLDDDGLKKGEWTFYYSNKNIKNRDFYKDGKLDKYSESYSELGIMQSNLPYKDDQVDGTAIYYKTTGAKSYTLDYKNDKIEGNYNEYFANGQLAFTCGLKEGKLDGKAKSYYPGGELKRDVTFVKGDIDGTEIFYYRNGKVMQKTNYKAGKYEGESISFYDNGKVSDSSHYLNNSIIGRYAKFSRDGVIEESGLYDETGKQNGIYKSYSNGKLHYELDYKKGEITAYRFYDENGKLLKEDKRKAGSFDYVGYHENGNIMSKGVYDRDRQQGEWLYYDYNGNLKSKSNFKDGKEQGEGVAYYCNQSIHRKSNYKDDKREGYFIEYFKNGNVDEEGNYKDGELEGTWIDYYPDKTISSINYYIGGEQNGVQKYYSPNGRINEAITYYRGVVMNYLNYDSTGAVVDSVNMVNASGPLVYHFSKGGAVRYRDSVLYGKKNGEIVEYYPDGKIVFKGKYFLGDKNGKWEWYYPDGTLDVKGQYTYGEPTGKWEYYNEDGKLTSIDVYRSGEGNYKATWYDDNGKISREEVYKNDQPDSTALFYSDGQPEHKRYFKNGEMVGYSYFDANGKEKKIDIKNGNADIKIYYKNGQLARQFTMKNGWYEGEFDLYSSTGKLLTKSNYVNDEANGVDIENYSDGTIKVKNIYYYGQLNGKQERYYPNGKLRETAVFRFGQLHGPREFYNKTGKLVEVIYYYNDHPVKIEKK